jgi:hypothetical protein
MKINWGFGIAVVYILFVVGMLSLVYKASQQNNDLVTNEYYEKAINYQQQIDATHNSLDKKEYLRFSFLKNEKAIEVNYPAISDTISGTITLYKPDNATLDFTVEMTSGASKTQKIKSKNLVHGQWTIKANWKNNALAFYEEQKIFIP